MRNIFSILVIAILVSISGCDEFVKGFEEGFKEAQQEHENQQSHNPSLTPNSDPEPDRPHVNQVEAGTVTVYYTDDVKEVMAKKFAVGYQKFNEIYHDVDIIMERTHDDKYYKLTLFTNEDSNFITNLARDVEAENIGEMISSDVVVLYKTPYGDHVYTAKSF